MTDFDQHYLYDTLDKSPVIKKTEKHNMAKGGYYYINTIYLFGDYKIVLTKYVPESKDTPLGHVCIYGANNKPFGSWNQTHGKKNMYMYDMYIAAKNKYEGKPYKNPYKRNPEYFAQLLAENSDSIFPGNIPEQERQDIIRRLQVMFMKNIEQYRGK